MKKAFHYKDAKSDKFWTIDYSDLNFAVNFGKYGTIGKYQIKEFISEDECVKEAEKLIASKLKKGYKEDSSFDFNAHFYIDDEEVGLHPKTSHPKFAEHFTDELYYDCVDEETPFGSDEGSDTLAFIGEEIRKDKDFSFECYPQRLVECEWEMRYIPVDSLDSEKIKEMAADEDSERDMWQSDAVTLATAFAQIKITGKITQSLKERAIKAIKRLGINFDAENSPIGLKMIKDLESFKG